MVTIEALDEQLKRVDCPIRMWGRAELKELCKVLLPGETIYAAVNGQYDAGFAMLVATDFRVLMVDKKPKYLTLRDIRYDMITELNYHHRLLNARVQIFTPNREMGFMAFSKTRLHKLFQHAQHKVMEIRNLYMMSQFQQAEMMKNMPPGLAMAMQRYGEAVDVEPLEANQPEAVHYYHTEEVAGREHASKIPEATTAPGPGATGTDVVKDDRPVDPDEDHHAFAVKMAHSGLRSIVRNGQVIKEHVTGPLSHLRRKRPYGYTRSAWPGSEQPAS